MVERGVSWLIVVDHGASLHHAGAWWIIVELGESLSFVVDYGGLW